MVQILGGWFVGMRLLSYLWPRRKMPLGQVTCYHSKVSISKCSPGLGTGAGRPVREQERHDSSMEAQDTLTPVTWLARASLCPSLPGTGKIYKDGFLALSISTAGLLSWLQSDTLQPFLEPCTSTASHLAAFESLSMGISGDWSL